MESRKPTAKYTCNEYRDEMTLLALKQKLANSSLTEDEKTRLREEITKLEEKIGL